MTINELHEKLQRCVDLGDGGMEVRLGRWNPVSSVRVWLPLQDDPFLSLQSVDD